MFHLHPSTRFYLYLKYMLCMVDLSKRLQGEVLTSKHAEYVMWKLGLVTEYKKLGGIIQGSQSTSITPHDIVP